MLPQLLFAGSGGYCFKWTLQSNLSTKVTKVSNKEKGCDMTCDKRSCAIKKKMNVYKEDLHFHVIT